MSPTIAAMMAFTTKTEGPNVSNLSKMDPIAQSKTCLSAVLRAFLVEPIRAHVLGRRKLESQATTVRLRGKAPDLIDFGEVFRACREENVPGESGRTPAGEREFQAANPRGAPVCACSREAAPGSR